MVLLVGDVFRGIYTAIDTSFLSGQSVSCGCLLSRKENCLNSVLFIFSIFSYSETNVV